MALLLAAAAAFGAGAALPESHPHLRLQGESDFRWWGLTVYRARLWTPPGFRGETFLRHEFALELEYRRAFRAGDIARRSIEEMRRAGSFTPDDAQRWQAALTRVLPDVQAGDRITGLHRPGGGATFRVNDRPAGEVADARFAALFFSIWLAPTTSEPQLRAALLGKEAP